MIPDRSRLWIIQVDVATLAGRVAEDFAHTTEGASLRASLPTLRRSAGLCPRCAQPYTGIADACRDCLKPVKVEVNAPAV
jgi:predicted amidophosphoribosyltransferase